MTARALHFPVLLLVSLLAPQESPVGGQELGAWGRSLDVDARIVGELGRYQADGGESLDEAYRWALARAVRQMVFEAAETRVSQVLGEGCNPFVGVTMLEPGFVTREGSGAQPVGSRKFEESIIRTEMVACVDTERDDPEGVLKLYTSEEFRTAAESRIEDMWEDGEGSCMETGGVMAIVDPTRICNRIDRFVQGPLASEHSQVVFNEGQKPFQDVYFKESLKTFVRVPGGLALHYVNFTRTVDMGRVERWVARRKVPESQERNVSELRSRIGR